MSRNTWVSVGLCLAAAGSVVFAQDGDQGPGAVAEEPRPIRFRGTFEYELGTGLIRQLSSEPPDGGGGAASTTARTTPAENRQLM